MNKAKRRWSKYGVRHWHRWLGLGSMIFLVFLSITGIALNHLSDLRLEQRYVRAGWLLDWYGIETPLVEASYAVEEHRATLLGERLYFNEEQVADGIEMLIGAIASPQFIVIASNDSLILLTHSGALVERMLLSGQVSSGAQAIGQVGEAIVLLSEEVIYQSDEQVVSFAVASDINYSDVSWSLASDVPSNQLEVLYDDYRGTGITVARLLADLHSGRLFTRAGPLAIDLVGVLLIALSVLGVILWLKGRPRRHRRTGRH